MKILAVDTATKTCSVAILDGNSIISEYTVNHNDTHSKFLMPMISDILNISHLGAKDLDGFAVTIGPGSFTGLRIGLSTVKGFAMAVDKPVVGISTLESLAYQAGVNEDLLICPMLDARRKEVYTACYRRKGNNFVCECSPVAITPEAAVEDINEPCMMIGDGSLTYQGIVQRKLGTLAFFADSIQHTIRAATVGHLAMQRFTAGDIEDSAHVQPVYLRKSDAEKKITAVRS